MTNNPLSSNKTLRIHRIINNANLQDAEICSRGSFADNKETSDGVVTRKEGGGGDRTYL